MRSTASARTATRTLAAAVTLVAPLACGDTERPTGPIRPPHQVPYVADARAGSGGATVERSDFPFGFVGLDPQANLAWFVGPLDPVAAVDIKCPDPSVIAPVSPSARSKIVTTPSGRVQVQATTRDAHIAEWQFSGPLTSLCDLVNAPVVATRVVRYTTTTTNVNVFDGLPADPGAATLHTNTAGVVDLTSGGRARLHATAQLVILPDGTLKKDEERIRLTPI